MTLNITLRGASYIADRPTRNDILTLGSLFLPGDTERERIEALQQGIDDTSLFNFDLDNPVERIKATAVVTVRLQTPRTKARIAFALRSLFPSLPDDLVRYRLIQTSDTEQWEDFGYKLEDEETLDIIYTALQYLVSISESVDPAPEPAKPAARSRKKSGLTVSGHTTR